MTHDRPDHLRDPYRDAVDYAKYGPDRSAERNAQRTDRPVTWAAVFAFGLILFALLAF